MLMTEVAQLLLSEIKQVWFPIVKLFTAEVVFAPGDHE